MSELVQVHSIGYNLTDVKVEFKKDTALDISGVSIQGKTGEILNIPRWSAEVLESEKFVEIQDIDMLCLLYTSPSPRDYAASRMPSSA